MRRLTPPQTSKHSEDREPRQLAARFQYPGCHTLPRKRREIETEASAGAKRRLPTCAPKACHPPKTSCDALHRPHLRVLEDAGLLLHDKRGRNRVYKLDQARLALVREWLEWFDR